MERARDAVSRHPLTNFYEENNLEENEDNTLAYLPVGYMYGVALARWNK